MSELNIRSWMRGRTILVTGATGFLGKVLVEKILRECGTVRKIYILLRARDKFELFDRFVKYKSSPAFGRLNSEQLDKLYPIRGDLSENKLGLSENDRNCLVSEVDVILHSGASVRFNEELDYAVRLNVRGTRELAELARRMPQLKVFVYISTAFSNCHLKEIKEEVYESAFDPQNVIGLCERQLCGQIAKDIEKQYPNVYIFTKNLSEKLMSQYAEVFPVAIVRPSIITPSEADPYPGWMDTKNGPMGLLLGGAAGLIRSAYGFKWSIADFMPVDKVANGIIVVAAEVGSSGVSTSPVYNLASSNDAPITWYHFLEIEKEIVVKNPYPSMVWYPGGGIHDNFIIFNLSFFFFQLLPSVVSDCILFVLGKRPWLIRFQIKAYHNVKLLSYFISRTWVWKTENCKALHHKLNFDERNKFNFKMCHVNYEKYFRNWHEGSKKYFLKVEAQASRKTMYKLWMLYYLEVLLKIVLFFGVFYVIVRIFGEHSLLALPKLESCSACSSVYAGLKGAYLRR